MAFWRPSTMDSWNPFSSKFWTFENLFGETELDWEAKPVYQLSDSLLANARAAGLQFIDYNNILICPLSLESIRVPAVTQDGVIYEKRAIKKHLKQHGQSPETRQPQLVKHLQSIEKALEFRQSRQNRPEMQSVIDTAAREYNFEESLVNEIQSYGAVLSFDGEQVICPITQEPLENPVITPGLQIFENDAIRQWLNNGNHRCPLTNAALRPDQLQVLDTWLATRRAEVVSASPPPLHQTAEPTAPEEYYQLPISIEELIQFGAKPTVDNNDLMCIISYDKIKEPVISPYMHVYEKSEIEKWIENHHNCPMTRQPLEINALQPLDAWLIDKRAELLDEPSEILIPQATDESPETLIAQATETFTNLYTYCWSYYQDPAEQPQPEAPARDEASYSGYLYGIYETACAYNPFSHFYSSQTTRQEEERFVSSPSLISVH